MINANELRIGNLIKRDDHILRVIQIKEIQMFRVEYVDKAISKNHMFIEHSSAEPIPLTEVILLLCGFSYDTYKTYSLKIAEYCYIQIDFTDDFCVKLSESFEIDNHSMEYGIKNLHQLQNLYFALTNKELQINL